MKTIETLVEDIYDLFRKDKPPISKKDVEENIDVFVEELRSHLLDFLYTKRKSSKDLRLSLIGKKDRQIWYELNTKTTTMNYQVQQLIEDTYSVNDFEYNNLLNNY